MKPWTQSFDIDMETLFDCRNVFTSVCHSVHRGGCLHLGPGGVNLPRQTHHPDRRTPLKTPLPGQTPPWTDTLLGKHHSGRQPPRQTQSLVRHPPEQTSPWIDNPLPGRHPLGRQPPPRRRPQQRMVCILLKCILVPLFFFFSLIQVFALTTCTWGLWDNFSIHILVNLVFRFIDASLDHNCIKTQKKDLWGGDRSNPLMSHCFMLSSKS